MLSNAFICAFKDLQIQSALIDEAKQGRAKPREAASGGAMEQLAKAAAETKSNSKAATASMFAGNKPPVPLFEDIIIWLRR